MPIHNADIAAVFDQIADLLEIKGENPFRIRAYRNAARTIGDLGQELRERCAQGADLTEIPGIGKDLAVKIQEIVSTGSCKALESLRGELPAGITDLLLLPGVGPKRVKTLYEKLQIESLDQLAEAAMAGRVRELPGFGEKTEQSILQSIQVRASQGKRFRRATVVPYVDSLLKNLAAVPGVRKVEAAGSYRRSRETVGDVDLLAIAAPESPIMDRFAGYDEVVKVLAKGETKSSVVLRSGLQADLRVVAAESYGSALIYFTGSKAHNIAMRRIAQGKKLKLNEYGVEMGEKRIAGRTEEEVYEALGMTWVPPELREDRGEIEASLKGKVPALVEAGDIRGDLHMHSTWSDGAETIVQMARAAKARGRDYVAITDHSKRLTVANGLDEKRLRKQWEEIDRIDAKAEGIAILKGIEVDILEDGSLDLPDSVLGELDIVVASVHSKFNLPRDRQTERVLRAMDRPFFSILAHPTGRLILSREPFEIDMERVIEHARQRGCFLELNAHPERLDLNDVHCQMAKSAGVLVSIDTDAHSSRDLDNLAHGVGQARRGWLGKTDVLNTRPLKELRRLLAATKRGKP
jgi:DNA polymerase (family X)